MTSASLAIQFASDRSAWPPKLLTSLAHRNDAARPPSEEPSIEEHDGLVTADGPAAVNEYDEVDRRLMDTFPASDAVARYCFDTDLRTKG